MAGRQHRAGSGPAVGVRVVIGHFCGGKPAGITRPVPTMRPPACESEGPDKVCPRASPNGRVRNRQGARGQQSRCEAFRFFCPVMEMTSCRPYHIKLKNQVVNPKSTFARTHFDFNIALQTLSAAMEEILAHSVCRTPPCKPFPSSVCPWVPALAPKRGVLVSKPRITERKTKSDSGKAMKSKRNFFCIKNRNLFELSSGTAQFASKVARTPIRTEHCQTSSISRSFLLSQQV